MVKIFSQRQSTEAQNSRRLVSCRPKPKIPQGLLETVMMSDIHPGFTDHFGPWTISLEYPFCEEVVQLRWKPRKLQSLYLHSHCDRYWYIKSKYLLTGNTICS